MNTDKIFLEAKDLHRLFHWQQYCPYISNMSMHDLNTLFKFRDLGLVKSSTTSVVESQERVLISDKGLELIKSLVDHAIHTLTPQ